MKIFLSFVFLAISYLSSAQCSSPILQVIYSNKMLTGSEDLLYWAHIPNVDYYEYELVTGVVLTGTPSGTTLDNTRLITTGLTFAVRAVCNGVAGPWSTEYSITPSIGTSFNICCYNYDCDDDGTIDTSCNTSCPFVIDYVANSNGTFRFAIEASGGSHPCNWTGFPPELDIRVYEGTTWQSLWVESGETIETTMTVHCVDQFDVIPIHFNGITGSGYYSIFFDEEVDDQEPNDTQADAISISPSNLFKGNNSNGGSYSVDYYHYAVPSDGAGSYKAYLYSFGGQGSLSIFGASSTAVSNNDGLITYEIECVEANSDLYLRVQNVTSCENYVVWFEPDFTSKVSVEELIGNTSLNLGDGTWIQSNGPVDISSLSHNFTNPSPGPIVNLNSYGSGWEEYDFETFVYFGEAAEYNIEYDDPNKFGGNPLRSFYAEYSCVDKTVYWPFGVYDNMVSYKNIIENKGFNFDYNDLNFIHEWLYHINDPSYAINFDELELTDALGRILTTNFIVNKYSSDFDPLIENLAKSIVSSLKSAYSLFTYIKKSPYDKEKVFDFASNDNTEASKYAVAVINKQIKYYCRESFPLNHPINDKKTQIILSSIVKQFWLKKNLKGNLVDTGVNLFIELLAAQLTELMEEILKQQFDRSLSDAMANLDFKPNSNVGTNQEYFEKTISLINPNSIYNKDYQQMQDVLAISNYSDLGNGILNSWADIMTIVPDKRAKFTGVIFKSLNVGNHVLSSAYEYEALSQIRASATEIAGLSQNSTLPYFAPESSSAERSSSFATQDYLDAKSDWYDVLDSIQFYAQTQDSINIYRNLDSIFVSDQNFELELRRCSAPLLLRVLEAVETIPGFYDDYNDYYQDRIDFIAENMIYQGNISDLLMGQGIDFDSLDYAIDSIQLELDTLETSILDMINATSAIGNTEELIQVFDYDIEPISDSSYELDLILLNLGENRMGDFSVKMDVDTLLQLTSNDSIVINGLGELDTVHVKFTVDKLIQNEMLDAGFYIEFSAQDSLRADEFFGRIILPDFTFACDSIYVNETNDSQISFAEITGPDTLCAGDDLIIDLNLFDAENLNLSSNVISNVENKPQAVATYDFDQDGDLDFAGVDNSSSEIVWFENDGNATFTRHLISAMDQGPTSLIAKDIDGDGLGDLVVSVSIDDQIVWYRNNGAGGFIHGVVATGVDYAINVDAVDMDMDNDMDIIAASLNEDAVYWYENDGFQIFTEHLVSNSINGPFSVEASDLDNDGDFDIYAAGRFSDDFVLFENDGNQNFTSHILASNFDGATDLEAADIDLDGDLDLVGVAYTDDMVVVLTNNGNLNFSSQIVSGISEGPYDVHMGDFDQDLDVDIMVSDFDGENIYWLKNSGKGDFSDAVEIAPGVDAIRMVSGNFNQDPFTEVVVAAYNDSDYVLISLVPQPFDGIAKFTYQIDQNPPIDIDSLTVVSGQVSLNLGPITGGDHTFKLNALSSYFECLVENDATYDFYVVPNILYAQDPIDEDFYQAVITVHSDALVGTATPVTYKAGTQICLDPGFEVTLGADFEAFIGPCQ